MTINLAARFAGAALALTSVSHAGECIAVGRDGLTARLVNPAGRVSGEVDASGCDIGVYYDRSTGSVENAEIHGARVAGVQVTEGARVGIEGVAIHSLGAGAAGVVFDDASGAVIASRIAAGTGPAVLARGPATRVIALDNRCSPVGIVGTGGAQLSERGNRGLASLATEATTASGGDEPLTILPLADAARSGTDLIGLLEQGGDGDETVAQR